MPTYTLRNKETEEVKDVIMSYSQRQEYCEANPEWENVITTPSTLVTHTGSILSKTSGDWKDHLKKMDKFAGRHSQVHH